MTDEQLMQVRKLRDGNELSDQEISAICTSLGIPQMTIYKVLNPEAARSLPIRIKEVLGRDGPSTAQQLAEGLGATKETTERTLRRLRGRGIAERIGKMWGLSTVVASVGPVAPVTVGSASVAPEAPVTPEASVAPEDNKTFWGRRKPFWKRGKIYKEVDEEKTRPEYLGSRMGSVYFIEAMGTGFVKIGRSRNSEDRVKGLQVGCPYSLKLLCEIGGDSVDAEKQFQKRFAKYHHRGEWFYASKEIRRFIKKINDKKKD